MATVFTDEAMQRADTMRQERTGRLAAQAHHMTVERDTFTGGWIVRNPNIPGTIELVSEHGECSCRRFRVWGRCKHAARVEVVHGASRTIMQDGRV